MNFSQIPFTELLSNIVDNRGKTCPTADFGIPLIATNCVKNTGLFPVYEKVRYVSQETYNTWFRGHPKPGDMIFVTKGSPGQVCWAPDPIDFCIAQDMVAIRADENKVYPKYLFALLRSEQVQNMILNMHVGTLIPHFKKGDFDKLVLPIPDDEDYQRFVGDTYFRLSNKIELNRQVNQTLEQIAQAIFKSWFVDFEPVKAKIQAKQEWNAKHTSATANAQDTQVSCEAKKPGATGGSNENAKSIFIERAAMRAISGKTDEELDALTEKQRQQLTTTAALFPDELVDSELGEIPKGWEFTSFGEVSTCFDSKRIPLSNRQREQRRGDIPYYGATSVMDYVDDYLFDDIFLLIGEDGSVLHEDGTPFIQYIWGKSWVNNHAHVLQGKNGVSTEQLMLFMQSQNITAYVTGAVQLKLNQKNMNSIPFIKAAMEINIRFKTMIEPLYAKYRQGTEEIVSLIGTRDLLLPKLLSGEIVLGKTKHSAEDVA